MIILSILLSLATFVIGIIVGMVLLMARLEKRGMLKDSDKEWKK